MAGFDVEFLYSQGDFPDTWTSTVYAICDITGEPDEPRVYLSILGTLLSMLDVTFRKLGKAVPELQEIVIQASSLLHEGVDEVAAYRALFSVSQDIETAFDFEIIKQASLLAIGSGQRAKLGWPYPDLWDGDLSLFDI